MHGTRSNTCKCWELITERVRKISPSILASRLKCKVSLSIKFLRASRVIYVRWVLHNYTDVLQIFDTHLYTVCIIGCKKRFLVQLLLFHLWWILLTFWAIHHGSCYNWAEQYMAVIWCLVPCLSITKFIIR